MSSEDQLDEIRDEFGTYTFGEKYEELRFDLERIVVKDAEINRVIAIDLNEYKSEQSFFRYLERYDFEKANRGLKLFKNKGFVLKKYSEFLLDIVPVPIWGSSDEELEDCKFIFNGFEIKVGSPSSLFKLLFGEIAFDDFSDEWNGLYTISVDGANVDEVDKIIEAALFIYSYTSNLTFLEYPKVRTFLGEWDADEYYHHSADDLKRTDNNYEMNYFKVIGLYNNGKRKEDPLSYYRVLEYFFLINHKKEIINAVNRYNNSNNDTDLVERIRDIFTDSEQSLLKYLLENIAITKIIDMTFEFGLIREKSVEDFSKELYLYRNKIVHSKEQSKFDIIIPTDITDETMGQWLIILEKVAFQAIMEFCIK